MNDPTRPVRPRPPRKAPSTRRCAGTPASADCTQIAAPNDDYCPYCRLLVTRAARADPRRTEAL